MVTKLNENQTQILGAAIVGLLHGELTDETIAAVDSINREDVPEPLNNMVGFMHGMSTYEPLRHDIIDMLLHEIAGATQDALRMHRGEPEPELPPWTTIETLLYSALESPYQSEMIPEMIELLPTGEQAGWAAPLTEKARSTKATGKELSLEILDELEKIIQKRRAELR